MVPFQAWHCQKNNLYVHKIFYLPRMIITETKLDFSKKGYGNILIFGTLKDRVQFWL
jgi:hypothetical protein